MHQRLRYRGRHLPLPLRIRRRIIRRRIIHVQRITVLAVGDDVGLTGGVGDNEGDARLCTVCVVQCVGTVCVLA
jgi:hypothetical protein